MKNRFPRVIDLVRIVRANGGIPNDVKYKNGDCVYNNVINYLEKEYCCSHRLAMDVAKYFMN